MNNQIIEFLKNRKVEITTKTKARGHLGFFCNDKIAISKNLPKQRQLEVLAHEYAHKIHNEIELLHLVKSKGGTLEKILNIDNPEPYVEELLRVTNFVDENSKCLSLLQMRDEYKAKVEEYEEKIKQEFPSFAKSKKFIEYDKYQKRTKCQSKYFLKYDHVKILSPFLMKNEFYSIEKLDEDFPDLPENFKNYFYLLSNYRKQKKVQNKIAKLRRYYLTPTELFARFVEGIVKNSDIIGNLAPKTFYRFQILAEQGYYKDLPELLNLIKLGMSNLK